MSATDHKTSHGVAHFAVFPDCVGAPAVVRRIGSADAHIVPHASGRPWLVGHWGDIVHAEAGRARIAIIGCCPVEQRELARHAAQLRDVAQLDHLARTLPGTFHLVAELDGCLRVQGSAAGLRLVFHAEVDGVVVAADRADVLAAAIGAEPDRSRVAARLLWPLPHPLPEQSMWRQVAAVPPGSALIVRGAAQARHSRWWNPPQAVRSIAEAAPDMREALTTAVDVRTRGRTVSCDLSGGLDSTSVAFLAARSAAKLLASTWPGRDRGDTDLWWALRAAQHLPEVEHIVWPAEQSPLVYADLLGIDDLVDEPTIGVMDRARMLAHLPELRDRGSELHLTGIGGDNVAWCSEAYYHRLLRRRPLFALRQLRGFRALWQWPLAASARTLADARSYRRWLADATDDLTGPPPPPVEGSLGWGAAPRVFAWMTADAVDLAGRVLRESAATARPLAPDRGMHGDLEQIRACTRLLRQWDEMAARAGLPMASPFLDDRVVEAFLTVRPEERVTPWHYKPALAAAMRGIVPDRCLHRANKAQAALDASAGLREHCGDLVALWENSRLAELGLVDAKQLRDLALRPDTPALREAILYSTIACEVWLRALEPAPNLKGRRECS